LRLPILLAQHGVQSIQARHPDSALRLHPTLGGVERLRIEGEEMVAPRATAVDEPGVFENADVFRNGIEGHRKVRGEFGDAGFTGGQAFEDGAASGVGESGEGVLEGGSRGSHEYSTHRLNIEEDPLVVKGLLWPLHV